MWSRPSLPCCYPMYTVNTASFILMVGLRRRSTDMVLAISDGDVHQFGIFRLL